tara:strand:- start:533 stop:5182 length:4650 start_codon:yes stop_codon:yes gene_type:complete
MSTTFTLLSYDGSGNQNITVKIETSSSGGGASGLAVGTTLSVASYSDQSSDFAENYIGSPEIQAIPSGNPNDWASYRLKGTLDNGANIFVYLSDVTGTDGFMNLEIHSQDWSQRWFQQGKTAWDKKPHGSSVFGFFPVFSQAYEASLSSPDGSGSSQISLGGSTYYMPNGRAENIDYYYGTQKMDAGFDFTSFVDYKNGITATGNISVNQASGVRMVGSFDGSSFMTIPQNSAGPGAPQNGLTQTFGSSDNFSIGVWFKTTKAGESYIWSQSGGSSSLLNLGINKPGHDNKAVVNWRDENGDNAVELFSSSDVNDGLWHHALVTYSGWGSSGYLYLYIDGVSQGYISTSGTYPTTSPNLLIGNVQGGSSVFFEGEMDDLRIFNEAKTSYSATEQYDKSRVLDPALMPTVTIDSTSFNLGDIMTATVDDKGYAIEYVAWEWLDYDTWVPASGSGTSSLHSQEVHSYMSSRKVKLSVKTVYGWGSSQEIDIPDNSSQIVPIQKNGYFPLFLSYWDAEYYSLGDGSFHSHEFDGQLYYMPNGLSMNVNQFHGNYEMNGHFSLDSDLSDSNGGDQANLASSVSFVSDAGRDVASFNGTDSYIHFSDHDRFLGTSESDFTFSVWVKPDDIQLDGDIFGAYALESDRGFRLYIDSGVLKFSIGGTTGDLAQYALPSDFADAWRMVTITRESTQVKIYIDSIKVIDQAISANSSIYASSREFYLGVNVDISNSSSSSRFTGKMDDFKIWSRVLDDSEVQLRYTEDLVLDPSLNVLVSLAQQDGYGDGWNGGSISITDSSGNVLKQITGPLDSDDQNVITEDIYLPNNAVYTYYVSGGQYPAEVKLWVYDANGNDLLQGALANGASSVTQGTFTLGTPYVPPSISSSVVSFSESEITLGITMNASATTEGDGWSYKVGGTDFTVGNAHGGTLVSGQSSQATFSVTPGENIIYVGLVNSSGDVIAKADPLIANTQVVELIVSKTDSYGDGWNGGNLVIVDNLGNTAHNTTLENGGKDSAITEQIQLPAGTYSYTFTANDYPSEIGFQIIDSATSQVLAQVTQGTMTASGQQEQGTFVVGQGASSSPQVTVDSISVSNQGLITVNASLNADATALSSTWAASLSSMGISGDAYSGATASIGQPFSLNVFQNGSYTVHVAAIGAEGDITTSTTSVIVVDSMPSVAISQAVAFVGDGVSAVIDPNGMNITAIKWQTSLDATSWSSVQEEFSSYSSGYTITEADNNKYLRVKLEFDNGFSVTSPASASTLLFGFNDGMVSKYVLGGDATDSHGSNDAALVEGVSFDVDADANNFYGRSVATISGGKIELPDSIVSSFNTAYSISMRIKPSGFAYAENYILSDVTSVGVKSAIDVYFDNDGKLYVTHRGANEFGSGHPYDTKSWGSQTISPDYWSHIVITWSKGFDQVGTLSFYLNGNLVSTAVMDQVPWDSSGPLRIGQDGSISMYPGFQGKVADVIIWSETSLHPIEVYRLYNTGWETVLPTASASVTLTYAASVSASDKLMVFVNGMILSPSKYTISEGSITFVEGCVSGGDEIYCAKVG